MESNPEEKWSKVDKYFEGLFMPSNEELEYALLESQKANLVPAQVSSTQGKFLQILALAKGAKRILEIGTLGGYSAIWMARALGPEGCLISLESDELCVEISRKNIERAGLSSLVEVIPGPALESLQKLSNRGCEAFDLIFIDADKQNNPRYLEWALKFSIKGTLIIGDNTVRNGEIVKAQNGDEKIRAIHEFHQMLGNNPRISATGIQTVGCKGYDGFTMAVVL